MGNLALKFQESSNRVLIHGLDKSGKTNVWLQRLQLGKTLPFSPSHSPGFNVHDIRYKSIRFTVWDVGKVRSWGVQFYPFTDILIYVVNSADPSRFSEASEELHAMLQKPLLSHVPVCVIANKQDQENACSAPKLAEHLELFRLKQSWAIFPAIATTGEGMTDAWDWICGQCTLALIEHRCQSSNSLNDATECHDVKVNYSKQSALVN